MEGGPSLLPPAEYADPQGQQQWQYDGTAEEQHEHPEGEPYYEGAELHHHHQQQQQHTNQAEQLHGEHAGSPTGQGWGTGRGESWSGGGGAPTL